MLVGQNLPSVNLCWLPPAALCLEMAIMKVCSVIIPRVLVRLMSLLFPRSSLFQGFLFIWFCFFFCFFWSSWLQSLSVWVAMKPAYHFWNWGSHTSHPAWLIHRELNKFQRKASTCSCLYKFSVPLTCHIIAALAWSHLSFYVCLNVFPSNYVGRGRSQVFHLTASFLLFWQRKPFTKMKFKYINKFLVLFRMK